jgi:hypothetical protein
MNTNKGRVGGSVVFKEVQEDRLSPAIQCWVVGAGRQRKTTKTGSL